MHTKSFSEDEWPWGSLIADVDGRVLEVSVVKRNGKTQVSPRPGQSETEVVPERDFHWALERGSSVLHLCTTEEMTKAVAAIRGMKKSVLDPDNPLHALADDWMLEAKIVELLEKMSLSRRQLRRLLGGRIKGRDLDRALQRLLKRGRVRKDDSGRHRLSHPT